MTTIAANKESIACDLQFTYGTNLKFKGKTKIFTFKHDLCQKMFGCPYAYVGLAGKVSDWGEVISWFADPEQDVPRIKGVEFLLLSSKGQLYHGSSLKQWMKLEEPFFSIGSGMDYAMGAMATGKDPLEAVKVAAKFDPMTGMGFQQFKIKET